MIRPFRTLAAVLSLTAMSLAVGESVWAATCAPVAPDVRALSTVAGAEASGELCGIPGGEDEGTEKTSDCPLSAIATFGGCVSSAILSGPESTLPPAPAGAEGTSSTGEVRHLLLASSIFHPPRA